MGRRAFERGWLDPSIHLLAVALLACTSTEGTTPDDPLTSDGGSRQRAEPSPDGEGSPGPSDPPPGGKSYCASIATSTAGVKASFCADFDDDLMKGWSSRLVQHGETRHQEQSFVAETTAVEENVPARAYLRKDFTELSTDIDYSFSVRIDQIGAVPNKGGTIAVLQFGEYPYEYKVQLNVYAGGRAALVEIGPAGADGGPRAYAEHELPSFTPGTWKRVAIRMSDGKLDVAMDGAIVIGAPVPVVVTPPSAPPSFFLGTVFIDPPSSPWRVRFDDVTVNLR